MKKCIPYAVLMVCIVALVSCNGFFAMQKKGVASFTLDTQALLRSIQSTDKENAKSRQVGIDVDLNHYIEARLTAGGKTQSIRQIFNRDVLKTELQFENVAVGSSARIVVEVYATEGSTKHILFIGRGKIESVKEGENAVTIKMGTLRLDTTINIYKDTSFSKYLYITNVSEPYSIDAVGVSVLKFSLYDAEIPCEYSFDGKTWKALTTIDEQVDISGKDYCELRTTNGNGDQAVYKINIQNTMIMLPDFNFEDPANPKVAIKYRTITNNALRTIVTHNVEPYSNIFKSLSNFAFDDEGNVYYAYTIANSQRDYYTTLAKISAQTKTSENIASYSNNTIINAVAVTQDRLYYANYSNVYYRSLDNLSSAEVSLTFPNLQSFTEISALAVQSSPNGDYIYIAGPNTANNNTIWKFKLDKENNNSITLAESILYSGFLNPYGTSSIVSDMIIFDGTLMVLVNEMDTQFSAQGYKSRGKLVVINTDGMTVVKSYGESVANHPTEENPQDKFLGPMRFIGVMPKKLFIADDGAYATSSSNVMQKNRIVTFDADTQALSAENVDVEFFYTVTGSGAWSLN